MDCSPPGSSVHGIFQARVLEWVAIAFSYKQHEASTKSLDNLNSASTVGTFVLSLLSRVQLFATLWAVAHQAPLSMGFSKQEYQSGLPFPSPGDLPDPRIEHTSPALQADSLPSEPPGKEFLYLKGNHLVLPYYSVSSIVLGYIRATEMNRQHL